MEILKPAKMRLRLTEREMEVFHDLANMCCDMDDCKKCPLFNDESGECLLVAELSFENLYYTMKSFVIVVED